MIADASPFCAIFWRNPITHCEFGGRKAYMLAKEVCVPLPHQLYRFFGQDFSGVSNEDAP